MCTVPCDLPAITFSTLSAWGQISEVQSADHITSEIGAAMIGWFDTAEGGMQEMSKAFLHLGANVDVEAEKVKESNKVL
jgi:hypothetical protein